MKGGASPLNYFIPGINFNINCASTLFLPTSDPGGCIGLRIILCGFINNKRHKGSELSCLLGHIVWDVPFFIQEVGKGGNVHIVAFFSANVREKKLKNLILLQSIRRIKEYVRNIMDIKAQYENLFQLLKKDLPLKAFPTRELVQVFRNKEFQITLKTELTITDIHNSGDISGIMCVVSNNEKNVIACALTHLHFSPDVPHYREIIEYQKKREKRIRKLNSPGIN